MNNNRRTDIDFSKHELTIVKSEDALIHKFKKPDSFDCMLIFINSCGVMSVGGDLGNWIFNREFHPSATNEHGVSDSYWDEKLTISSVQNSHKYDSEETRISINKFKNSFKEDYGREMNEEESEWVEDLESNVDDEHAYTYVAYRLYPDTITDIDYIPYGTKRHYYLDAVYDGFEAICKKLKKMEI